VEPTISDAEGDIISIVFPLYFYPISTVFPRSGKEQLEFSMVCPCA